MRLNLETANIFVPDGQPVETALARTTHMGIGAHQDDLEILAVPGILECFQQRDKWFSGVVVTNGSGSPRADLYSDYTDDEMRAVRYEEQKKAAVVGEYSTQVFLDYPSIVVKDASSKLVIDDLKRILSISKPEVIFTHNLADKHDTHVGVTLRVIEAVRFMDEADRPKKLYGCEIWRDLDWMVDEEKITFDTSTHENLQAALLGVYDSQICGGKRYDLATMGRRRANATYYASHDTDIVTGMIYAMDLTPLIRDPEKDINAYLLGVTERAVKDMMGRLDRLQGSVI